MRKLILGLSFICCHFTLSVAQNPFVQTWFTTDPAPMVHDGTMYVYTGHDEDGADFFWMQEWRIYSSQDMIRDSVCFQYFSNALIQGWAFLWQKVREINCGGEVVGDHFESYLVSLLL